MGEKGKRWRRTPWKQAVTGALDWRMGSFAREGVYFHQWLCDPYTGGEQVGGNTLFQHTWYFLTHCYDLNVLYIPSLLAHGTPLSHYCCIDDIWEVIRFDDLIRLETSRWDWWLCKKREEMPRQVSLLHSSLLSDTLYHIVAKQEDVHMVLPDTAFPKLQTWETSSNPCVVLYSNCRWLRNQPTTGFFTAHKTQEQKVF